LPTTSQRPAPCSATEGCLATAKILINLQTIEITYLIFPLRNTGGVGVAGSNPAVPTNLFNNFRCFLEAVEVFLAEIAKKLPNPFQFRSSPKKYGGHFLVLCGSVIVWKN